jgi:hypothetical protein
MVEQKLNDRYMAVLGYKTLKEALEEHRSHTRKQPADAGYSVRIEGYERDCS